MNIKEIIDEERTWACESLQVPDPVLFMLDRIEAKVTERIEELEGEVEIRGRIIDGKIQAIYDMLSHIKELEAQVPRVVKPKFNVGNFDCPDCEYRTLPEPCLYCPGCGAKLDWEDK